MELTNTREIIHVRDADLTDSSFSSAKLTNAQFDDVNLQGSTFTNVNLAGAQFDDVNWQGPTFKHTSLAGAQFDDVSLQGSTFVDVNLAGAQIRNVNLAGATIEDANLTGMSINGALVTDLIRAFGRRARMVLYAKDLATMREFYQGVFHLEIEQSEKDHVVLGSSTSQLVIVQVPAAIASTIQMAHPPVRRAQTPIKLVFDVESIAAVRRAVLNLRGGIDPTESEWVFQGHRVCDGNDPEGNVVQFQEEHQHSGTRADSAE
jgi:predicted enzyme related to lactoylglutathione lyase